MAILTEIFPDMVPARVRNALGDYVKENKFLKIALPGASAFIIANTMVNAGINPKDIVISDISLISSVVGYHIADKDLSELNIETTEELTETNPIGSLVFAITLAQTDLRTYYGQAIYAELKQNKNQYIANISTALDDMKKKLYGMSYNLEDVQSTLKKFRDENALIFIAANADTKKPKWNTDISWNTPAGKLFRKKQYKQLLAELGDANATAVLYSSQDLYPFPAPWATFYAEVSSQIKIQYLITNKSPQKKYLSRKTTVLKPLNIPILSQQEALEIAEDSTVTFIQVHRDTADYYRDLFVHRLGAVSAEHCWLALIGGKIFGTLGVHGQNVRLGIEEYLMEVYGITRSFAKPRITRLFMRLITSKEFTKEINLDIYGCKGIKTVCLLRDIDIKRNRGILTVVSKERQENNLWKVKYITDWHNKTYKECIKEWLDEEQYRGRNKKGRNRKPRASSGSR